MASLRAFPALKPGTFDALILIASPVLGLRPVRAARLRTENVPKPTKVTVSPFLRALVTASIAESSALPAAAFDKSAESATASISSALFIVIIPLLYYLPQLLSLLKTGEVDLVCLASQFLALDLYQLLKYPSSNAFAIFINNYAYRYLMRSD